MGSPWSNLRRGARSEGSSVSYLCLVAALDSGWQIREAAQVPGHGHNGANSYLLVRLSHPTRNLESELTLEKTAHAEALLREHRVPVA
jgi:hypothetical protein